jgi:hypothetical protein
VTPSGTAPLSDGEMSRLVGALSMLYDELPEDWVFAGVLLVMDFEYVEHVSPSGPWVAMATKTRNTQLGPIPEARGYGESMAGAITDLRIAMTAQRTTGVDVG